MNWPAAALRLAGAIPAASLHPAVMAWAKTSSASARWSVAFSGGADSLALLLLLWAHWPKRRTRLQALHFNHRLRGRDSLSDVRFCRRVCAALQVKFISRSWAEARAGASEAAARDARHAFLARHSRALWLGHQQDDIAETQLMRLARGSGAGGLAAPRPVQPMPGQRRHLRPLLTLKKTEIVTHLRRAEATWCEDASNWEENYFRNRIRHRLLPAWIKASQRDALAGAARSRELLEEDEQAFDVWLKELQPLTKKNTLRLAPLAGKPRALVRRALHRWLLAQPQAGDLSRQGFDTLLAAVERGTPTRQSLGAKGFGVIRGGELSWIFHGKRRGKFQRRIN